MKRIILLQGITALFGAVLTYLLAPCTVNAQTDRLVVESRTVYATQTFDVGIYLENSIELGGITLPLVCQSTSGGAYPSSLTARYNPSGRLWFGVGAPLTEVVLIASYDSTDGNCKNSQPGGFATVTSRIMGGEFLDVATPSSPDGLLFVRNRVFSPQLQAGSDFPAGSNKPSLVLNLQAGNVAGSFYIDTTCINPGSHLAYVDHANQLIVPQFTPGAISVEACDCPNQGDLDRNGVIDTSDLHWAILVIFFAGPDPRDATCPRYLADVNADGYSDSSDLNWLISYLYFNGSICNPCNPVEPACH